MDIFLQNLIISSLHDSKPTDNIIYVSNIITGNKSLIDEIQESFTFETKFIVQPENMAFIVKYDMLADSILNKKERCNLMLTWNASELLEKENISTDLFYVKNLEKVLDSEIELARGCNNDPMKILYHRTRSFAYSLLFCLRKELINFLNDDTLHYTCCCALAAVIMDDADDMEEDLHADSPTLFTIQDKNVAIYQALNVIGNLQSQQRDSNDMFKMLSSHLLLTCDDLNQLNGDVLLNIFLCMGLSKCLQLLGGQVSHIFNTRKFLLEISSTNTSLIK